MLHMDIQAGEPRTVAQKPDDTLWSIAQLARDFDITARTLRFYEDKGLLSPKRLNGARIYGAHDRARLAYILRGKRLGFSLDDMRSVLEVTGGLIQDKGELSRRKQTFDVMIEGLRRRRSDIETLSKDMEALCALIDTHIENSGDDAIEEELSVFKHAKAYDAIFRQYMDEDFLSL
jgi:DNA-binding transcriptional MerR regulator